MRITSFRGTFLSNFWPVRVKLAGRGYPSVENAYVAAKVGPLAELRICSPSDAKKLGRRHPVVAGWCDARRLEVMEDLLRQKFARPELKAQLLATGEAELVEENTWGDVFWGVCEGVGDNRLGRLLMRLRAELAR